MSLFCDKQPQAQPTEIDLLNLTRSVVQVPAVPDLGIRTTTLQPGCGLKLSPMILSQAYARAHVDRAARELVALIHNDHLTVVRPETK